MVSPWPAPDVEAREVMCCLCFEIKSFDDMSMTPDRKLIDVCQDCRMIEIQLVLKKRGTA
ncbi:hypothetical protein SEA_LIBERTYBELL_69 [Streptomyces phage LibertyBell]|nr:hypothetical protein SEA_LIBERTYBELL_69 [Streptomyces phage LibertyBell]